MENDKINPDLLIRLWRKKGCPGFVRFKKYGMQLEWITTPYGTFLVKAEHDIFVRGVDLTAMTYPRE